MTGKTSKTSKPHTSYMRTVFLASANQRVRFYAAAVVMLCLVSLSAAQSGRKKTAGIPASPPVVSPKDPDPQPVTDPDTRITSMVVTGKIFDPYVYSKSSFLESALKECVNTLRTRQVDAAKANSMNLVEAKERAKKETQAFILWLGFTTRDDGYGNEILDYADYSVFIPQTGRILTNGRIESGQASPAITNGGVLQLPRTTTRPTPTIANRQMKQVAREVVDRLTHGGWLD